MLVELLADGGGPAGIGFDGGNTGGRRRRRITKKPLLDPDAAEDGRSGRAIRGYLQNAGLGEQAATDGIGRERDLPQGDAIDGEQAVMTRQMRVEHGEVGVDERG